MQTLSRCVSRRNFLTHAYALILILPFLTTIGAERASAAPPPPPPPPPNPNQYTTISESANQRNVGVVLDVLRATAAGDMLAVINQLDALGADQRRETLSQIGPVQYSALPSVCLAATAAQTGAVSNRLTALRSKPDDPEALFYARRKIRRLYPGTLLAEAIGDTNSGLLADRTNKLGFYGSLLGALGRQFGDFDAPGFSFNGQGFSLGADYRVADAAAVGVSAGFIHSHASVDSGGGTTEGRTLKYGVYGTAARAGWFVDAYFGGGRDFYSSQRVIAALGREAESTPQGHEFNMKLSVGLDRPAGRFIVTPFTSFSHDFMIIDEFTETGAGALNLQVQGRTIKSTKATLGLRVKQGGKRRFKPYLSAAWQHECEGQYHSLTSSLAGGGQTFVTQLATPDVEAALVGVGFETRIAGNVDVRSSYDGEYRSGYISHGINGSARLKF